MGKVKQAVETEDHSNTSIQAEEGSAAEDAEESQILISSPVIEADARVRKECVPF